MPYRNEWVAPDLFVEHTGVKIYHVYKDEDENEPREFWYTTSLTEGDCSGFDFDVRNLPDYDSADHDGTIKRAIEAGLLKQDERPSKGLRQ